MTRQEIFDKVWLGAQAQGFERSLNSVGGCVYRGLKGRKCHAGHLIPDEVYREKMEGAAFISLLDYYPEIADLFNEEEINFINDLQSCHDSAYGAPDVERRLRSFAADNNLTIPSETAR